MQQHKTEENPISNIEWVEVELLQANDYNDRKQLYYEHTKISMACGSIGWRRKCRHQLERWP